MSAFRSQLDGETLVMIDRLRAIVAASNPSLVEGIKWNAPSFAIGGDDRITLGVERKGGVRLVLHRGAKPMPNDGFAFEDTDGLARWPAADRGVIVWKDVAAIDRAAPQLILLCRRWIEHVRGDSFPSQGRP
jgi:hypothetical protein